MQEGSLQIKKAEDYIIKGIEILKGLKARSLYSIGYLYLGELYLNADQKSKAIKSLNKAENLFDEMRMEYWLENTQEVQKGLLI